MAIRTRGRSVFNYEGRRFVWHVADEMLLRIASADKRFSVAYEFVGTEPLLFIGGPEFMSIPQALRRPVLLVPPTFPIEIGGRTVRTILDWCFDPAHEIVPYRGSPGTTIERAWNSLSE